MKLFSVYLFFVFFLGSQFLNAQDKPKKENLNEVKLEMLKAIGFPALDFSYERIINDDMGLGATLFVNFARGNDFENFSFTPFYRFYFLNKHDFGAKGFFVEVFSKLTIGEYYSPSDDSSEFNEYSNEYLYSNIIEPYTDVALGITLGKKWIHKKRFIFELNGGVGRNLGISENSPSFTPRFGLSFGYRF